MSKIMNVVLAIPNKGTTINRQIKACKKVEIIHAASTSFLTGTSFINCFNKEFGLGIALFIGATAALYNTLNSIYKLKNLNPKYSEIVERAKNIYKNK